MARDYNVTCRSCTKTVHAGSTNCHWCGTLVDPPPFDHVVGKLGRLMFEVAILRDLSTGLSLKDRRALDSVHKSLEGVKKRREGAS